MSRIKLRTEPKPSFRVFANDDDPNAPWVAVVGDNRHTVWALLTQLGTRGVYVDGYLHNSASKITSDLTGLSDVFSHPEYRPDVLVVILAPYAARVLLEHMAGRGVPIVVVGEPWSGAEERSPEAIFTGAASAEPESLALVVEGALESVRVT